MLFQQPAGWYERETRTRSDEETDGRSERTTAIDHHLEASSHAAAKPTKACLSASSSKHATSAISRRRPSDMGSTKQVQAENASAPRKNSSNSETRLNDIHEEPRRCIGPSRVKQLAKFFTLSSDEEDQSRVNNRTRRKRLFNSEEKEGRNESEKK